MLLSNRSDSHNGTISQCEIAVFQNGRKYSSQMG